LDGEGLVGFDLGLGLEVEIGIGIGIGGRDLGVVSLNLEFSF
jgi:hypothetical protein